MYQVLYRKWRPKTFADVVGQPHVTETLKNELRSDRIAHAYLFTGSRGTGKTTCAKIFAKAVNCLHPVDGNPCCECEICRGIEDESIMDVTEMDAASNRKIEDIRDLMEEIRYTPAQAKYRVFIVDEVHMLTTEAFNALLKTLEEPPSYVIFILATTEPHKLPATILSRCQRFDFHRVQPQAICDRLKYIARQEGGDIDDDAGLMIARLADGGMRDALSILDQAMGKNRQVNALTVCETVGMAGTGYINEIADHIANKDCAALMKLVSELYANSKDMLRLCDELIGYFRSIMILCTVKNADGLIVASDSAPVSQEQSAAIASLLRRIESLERAVRSGAVQATAAPQGTIPILGTASDPNDKAKQDGKQNAPAVSATVRELSDGAKPYGEWNRALEMLESANKPAYSVLSESRAFLNGKYLLIETNGFGRDMLRNAQVKESIRQIIRQLSGIDCRLGPYVPSGAVQYIPNSNATQSSENAVLAAADKIKQRAAEAGIDVEDN